MRDSPWFHQKRSESAPPVERVRDIPSITQKEQEDITTRLSRPTESALYRQSMFWKLDGFMDRGFHSWSKMDLFQDCKRCMWNNDGAIKRSCKIRPLDKNLPPLMSSRDNIKSCQSQRSKRTVSRCSQDSREASKEHKNNGTVWLRGMSRDGICIRKASTDTNNRNMSMNKAGFLSLQMNGYGKANVPVNLAIPRIHASARPLAATGQRI